MVLIVLAEQELMSSHTATPNHSAQRSTAADRDDAAIRPCLAAAILLGLAIAAPIHSAGADATRPVRSMIEIRQEGVVMQNFDLSCGAAALATILTYQYGDPVPEREIARELIRRKEYIENPDLVRYRQGFSLADLKRYVDGRGYEGIGYGQLELADLIELAPILVPVSVFGYNHFVVFRGIRGGRVVLADPAYGNRVMRVDRFERAWLTFPELGKVGFVIATRDGTQLPNRLSPKRTDLMRPSDALLRSVVPFSGPG
jgi:hypothetical protein